MTRGERRRVAALVEDAVRPRRRLPPVAQTDAVAAFDALAARRTAPEPRSAAARALLRAAPPARARGRDGVLRPRSPRTATTATPRSCARSATTPTRSSAAPPRCARAEGRL